MRIQVHDFAGHPFQAQLSRELAARGHAVAHRWSAQYSANHGRLAVEPGDPARLDFVGLVADRPAEKYHPVGRLRFERAYARAWIADLERDRPDVVICANVPLLVLSRFAAWARRTGQPWVLWHQDVVSAAMSAELARTLPGPVAAAGGAVLDRLERRAVRGARRVIAIGSGFLPVYERWGLPAGRAEVVPNWAPLDEIVPRPRDNPWAAEQGYGTGRTRLLYAGTLGRKHRPELLLDLARRLEAGGLPVVLTVVSEGDAAAQLVASAAADPHLDVRVLPFQPMERLSDVLGSADVLLALLETDASRYSIPSKVQSYFAAGRPVVGFMPGDNPAALDTVQAGGAVVPPSADGVETAADWVAALVRDDAGAATGATARAFAERHYDVHALVAAFERVLVDAADLPQTERVARV